MPINVPKFITRAWASLGQKFDIPENADPLTGKAGYAQGFGPVNLTPVEAGGIPPWGQDMNGVLYDLSTAIQYVQSGRAFPFDQDFANAIGGYGKGAFVTGVSDQSILYQSTVNDNTTPPPSEGWQVFTISDATESAAGIVRKSTQAEAEAGASNVPVLTPLRGLQLIRAAVSAATETLRGTLQIGTQEQVDAGTLDTVAVTPKKLRPSFSGSATLTAIDNKIVLSGIVPALNLEKGDVIRIDGAGVANANLRTVESIANNNELVVNYMHCGAMGNGSLKLVNFAGEVTVTRIAKWFNAPLGLGQAWVDVAYTAGATVTSSLGRPSQISVTSVLNQFSVTSNGVTTIIPVDSENASSVQIIVGDGESIKSSFGSAMLKWRR